MKSETTTDYKLVVNIGPDHFSGVGRPEFIGECFDMFMERMREKYLPRKMLLEDLYAGI